MCFKGQTKGHSIFNILGVLLTAAVSPRCSELAILTMHYLGENWGKMGDP